MIIDCFPYFNEKELLELRIKLLYDKVDKFVITEGDHTHKGDPKPFTFLDTAKELNLPMDKIIYIQVALPSAADEPNAWVRERIQRNAASKFINEGDVAFISDADEIINPDFIEYYSNMVKLFPSNILRIPLAFLCSKANLRVHDLYGNPVPWSSPFMIMKHHLNTYTLSDIRESHALNTNNIQLSDIFITENGVVQDAGWHFSWMGNSKRRQTKLNAFLHWDEVKLTANYKAHGGSLDPLGRRDHILFDYSASNLPALIDKLPNVKEFLFNAPDDNSDDENREAILTEVGQNNHFNWQGHRPFAEWLVKELKPKVTVDLGVDFGYSSFCFSLPNIGKVYGIDCFEGDAWAGKRNTYDYVLEKQKELKLDNLQFIKGYFDDVVVDWKDTINILHIDGFHSYEAVKNDYEKWSPFLDENSVVLFHDTVAEDPKFGVDKFFKELDLYKTNFGNSYGLGVASKNKNIINKIKTQFANNIFEITTNKTENTLISILEQNPFITTDKNSVCFHQYKDRWSFNQYHSYIEGFYEEHFAKYKDKKNKILEIGIDTGGSIALWHKYFSNSTILAVDIEYSKGRLLAEYNEDKLDRAVYAYVKDGYDPVFANMQGNFDIIIDDGPHTIESQINVIKYYLPKLNKDGMLVIEDIASIEYAMDLYNSVPDNSNYEKILVDLREKDNRFDSIILAVKRII